MRKWFVAAILAVALPGGPAPAQAPDAATLGWLQATGHRLAASEPTAAELAPLIALLRGARVVGLGEVTHGTHEDGAFKALLVRELVRAGAIDTLAIEANRTVGVGFDRYLRFGEGDPAALVLSPSNFKPLKTDEFAGLLLWLRAWNLAHPLEMVGATAIDDQDGAVDAAFALDFLARRDPARAARLRTRFGSLLPAPSGPRVRPSDWIGMRGAEEVQPVLAAAAELRDTFAAHARDWGADPAYAEAAYAARIAWQNIHVFERDVKGADIRTFPGDYWSRRDRFMAENLIARLGDGHRAALWAHNDHVVHTISARWIGQDYVLLGTELRRHYGPAYRTVGTTYSTAQVTATRSRGPIDQAQLVGPSVDEIVPLDNTGPDSAGRLLARLPGDAWWFDPKAPGTTPAARDWLARPVWLGNVGWIVDPTTFQKADVTDNSLPFGMGFDAVVWFRALSPQHRWPGIAPVATPAAKP